MPIEPISWIIIGLFAGFAVGVFWDEIKAWATRVLGYILDAVNRAIEVTSDAIVYLVKQGTRIYKRIEVYVRNVNSGGTRIEYRQEEVSPYEIPDDIQAQLERKQKLKLIQQST
ncbi:MAG: hypothetical protein QNJ63_00110 [Calothrix sp. MO_192.B10]|nr:hypothetical protein [Calothrix sp. MO_192.B10]